jgi:hypothetical protein
MSDPVPSSAIYDATTGGLSVIVITGGSTGDVLTQQSDGTYAPVTPSSGGVSALGTSGTDLNISGSTLNVPDVSATARGVVTTGTQTIAGAKTFTSKITAPATGQRSTGGIGNGNNGVDFFGGLLCYFANGYPAYFCGSSGSPRLKLSSNSLFGFGNSTDAGADTALDTGLARNAAGVWEVNNGTAGTFRDLIVRNLRMSAPTLAPASASATGSEGQIAWDASYIYVCTATNTWKRVAIATW